MKELFTRELQAKRVHSDSNLDVVSRRKIQFETPRMLVRCMAFETYINDLLFRSHDPSRELHRNDALSESSVARDVGSMGEYTTDRLNCVAVSSEGSYEVDAVSERPLEHYVHLSAGAQLRIRSENIFVNSESLNDYVYRLVNPNRTRDGAPDTEKPLSDALLHTRRDVTHFGQYRTKHVVCDTLTSDHVRTTLDPSGEEPTLRIVSNSAVNLQSSNILIYDADADEPVDFDTYAKKRLDESSMFAINISTESGVDISFEFDDSETGEGFSNHYRDIPSFTYDVDFFIVPTSNVPPFPSILDRVTVPFVAYENTPLTTTFTLTNLEAGNFYDIYANVTNRYTTTVVENIGPIAYNVPTIENVVLNAIRLVSENTIACDFTPHQTIVPSWSVPTKNIKFHVELLSVNEVDVSPRDLVDLTATSPTAVSLSDLSLENLPRTDIDHEFTISNFTTYDPGDLIPITPVPGSTSIEVVSHTFRIVSKHNDATSPFEMFSNTIIMGGTIDLPTWSGGVTLSSEYVPSSNQHKFIWTLYAADGTTLLDVVTSGANSVSHAYVIKKGGSVIKDGISTTYSPLLASQTNGIANGTYNLFAKNAFHGMSSVDGSVINMITSTSIDLTISSLTVSSLSWASPTSDDRKWRLVFTISQKNGDVSVYQVISNPANKWQTLTLSDVPTTTYKSITSSQALVYGTHSIDTFKVYDNAKQQSLTAPADLVLSSKTPTASAHTSYMSTRTIRIIVAVNPPADTAYTVHPYTDAQGASVTNVFGIKSFVSASTKGTQGNTELPFSTVANADNKFDLQLKDEEYMDGTAPSIKVTAQVKDTFGYTSLTLSNFGITLPVLTFEYTSTISAVANQRVFTATTISGVSFTYTWYVDNVLYSGSTTYQWPSATTRTGSGEDPSNIFGDVTVKTIYRNSLGFKLSKTSPIVNNPLPTQTAASFSLTMSTGLFTISGGSTKRYGYEVIGTGTISLDGANTYYYRIWTRASEAPAEPISIREGKYYGYTLYANTYGFRKLMSTSPAYIQIFAPVAPASETPTSPVGYGSITPDNYDPVVSPPDYRLFNIPSDWSDDSISTRMNWTVTLYFVTNSNVCSSIPVSGGAPTEELYDSVVYEYDLHMWDPTGNSQRTGETRPYTTVPVIIQFDNTPYNRIIQFIQGSSASDDSWVDSLPAPTTVDGSPITSSTTIGKITIPSAQWLRMVQKYSYFLDRDTMQSNYVEGDHTDVSDCIPQLGINIRKRVTVNSKNLYFSEGVVWLSSRSGNTSPYANVIAPWLPITSVSGASGIVGETDRIRFSINLGYPGSARSILYWVKLESRTSATTVDGVEVPAGSWSTYNIPYQFLHIDRVAHVENVTPSSYRASRPLWWMSVREGSSLLPDFNGWGIWGMSGYGFNGELNYNIPEVDARIENPRLNPRTTFTADSSKGALFGCINHYSDYFNHPDKIYNYENDVRVDLIYEHIYGGRDYRVVVTRQATGFGQFDARYKQSRDVMRNMLDFDTVYESDAFTHTLSSALVEDPDFRINLEGSDTVKNNRFQYDSGSNYYLVKGYDGVPYSEVFHPPKMNLQILPKKNGGYYTVYKIRALKKSFSGNPISDANSYLNPPSVDEEGEIIIDSLPELDRNPNWTTADLTALTQSYLKDDVTTPGVTAPFPSKLFDYTGVYSASYKLTFVSGKDFYPGENTQHWFEHGSSSSMALYTQFSSVYSGDSHIYYGCVIEKRIYKEKPTSITVDLMSAVEGVYFSAPFFVISMKIIDPPQHY